MAPNSYVSTYQGDFGGRQSKSFTGGKQGPSLVARQSKGYTGESFTSENNNLKCEYDNILIYK